MCHQPRSTEIGRDSGRNPVEGCIHTRAAGGGGGAAAADPTGIWGIWEGIWEDGNTECDSSSGGSGDRSIRPV